MTIKFKDIIKPNVIKERIKIDGMVDYYKDMIHILKSRKRKLDEML